MKKSKFCSKFFLFPTIKSVYFTKSTNFLFFCIFSVGFCLLLMFLFLSTITDILLRHSKFNNSTNSGLIVLSKFSVYSNAVRLLSTKTTPQTLPAIQGLRFFSMCWVILGHDYFMFLSSRPINSVDLGEVRNFFYLITILDYIPLHCMT